MSWEASNWARSVKTGSASTKLVLLLLADLADEHHSCFPGQARLAADAEMHVNSVANHLRKLEEFGLICREHRYDGRGKRTSDRFFLAVDGQFWIDPLPTPDVVSDYPHEEARLTTSGGPTTHTQDVEEQLENPQSDPPANSRARDVVVDPLPAVFEAFCSVWPGNVPVRPALAAWTSAVRRTNGRPHLILTGASEYARWVAETGTEPRFVRAVVKWLNEDGWRDRLAFPDPRSKSTTDQRATAAVELANRLRAEEAATPKEITQ